MDEKSINISKHLSIHSLLQSISSNFIKLFVPLIVLQNVGYKICMLYIILLSVSNMLALTIFSKLVIKNPILCVCLHIVFSICSYITIAVFPITTVTSISNAILTGTSEALYHAPIFSIISSNKNGKGFSSLKMFSFIGSTIMLIINGYILNINKAFSIWLTCLISFVIYIASLIPFFMIKNKIQLKSEETKPFKEIIKKTTPFNVFHIAFGLQDLIVGIIIPLYLYINDLSLQTISYVVAIVNVVKIFFVLLANLLYKKDKSFWGVLFGCIIFAIPCIMLPLIESKIFVYILSVIISISFPLFFISDCNAYAVKTEGFSHKGMILREILVHSCRPLIILPFIFITNLSYLIYSGVALAVILIISAYYMFIKKT